MVLAGAASFETPETLKLSVRTTETYLGAIAHRGLWGFLEFGVLPNNWLLLNP